MKRGGVGVEGMKLFRGAHEQIKKSGVRLTLFLSIRSTARAAIPCIVVFCICFLGYVAKPPELILHSETLCSFCTFSCLFRCLVNEKGKKQVGGRGKKLR